MAEQSRTIRTKTKMTMIEGQESRPHNTGYASGKMTFNVCAWLAVKCL